MYHILATSAFFSAYVQSDFFGKMIFWVLYFLSIVSWVLIISRWRLFRKLNRINHQISSVFDKHKENTLGMTLPGHFYSTHPYLVIYRELKQQAIDVLKKNTFFMKEHEKSEVYLATADIEMIGSYLQSVIALQTKKLGKNLFILSMTSKLAPFFGLLGTVWGILTTFSNLQTHSLSSGNTAILGGLAMALGTTVVGLIVAIPSLIGYHYLKNATYDATEEMDHFAHSLINRIEMQYRNVEKVMK